jgi:hypothetical protein
MDKNPSFWLKLAAVVFVGMVLIALIAVLEIVKNTAIVPVKNEVRHVSR